MPTIASRDEAVSRTAMLCEIINLLYIGAASVAVKEFGFFFLLLTFNYVGVA
jgi:hypothetical protein